MVLHGSEALSLHSQDTLGGRAVEDGSSHRARSHAPGGAGTPRCPSAGPRLRGRPTASGRELCDIAGGLAPRHEKTGVRGVAAKDGMPEQSRTPENPREIDV